MKIVYILIKLVVLIALLLLAISNTQTVTFNYLSDQAINLPLIALLLIFFIIGAVFGVFAMFGRLLQLRNHTNQLQKQVKKEQDKSTQLLLKMDALQSAKEPDFSATMSADAKK